MEFFTIVLLIFLAAMIGNQYSMLKRMKEMENLLRDIRDNNKK